MITRIRPLLATAFIFAATGCATGGGTPTLQTGPDAEVTVDGLTRVDDAAFPIAYRKADLDLTQYTRFMLDPVEVAYQKDPGQRRRSGMGASNNFALSQSQMNDLRETFQESVEEALTEDNGYDLVTEPGPDVLRISASLIDLVVMIPTEQVGMQDVYANSYGLVTLVLEFYDSESGEVLARGADRRDPTRPSARNLSAVKPAFVRADVKRLFDEWAGTLRERFDAFKGGM